MRHTERPKSGPGQEGWRCIEMRWSRSVHRFRHDLLSISCVDKSWGYFLPIPLRRMGSMGKNKRDALLLLKKQRFFLRWAVEGAETWIFVVVVLYSLVILFWKIILPSWALVSSSIRQSWSCLPFSLLDLLWIQDETVQRMQGRLVSTTDTCQMTVILKNNNNIRPLLACWPASSISGDCLLDGASGAQLTCRPEFFLVLFDFRAVGRSWVPVGPKSFTLVSHFRVYL